MGEHPDTEFSSGFVPIIRAAGNATLREGGAVAVVAGGDASIREGGAGFCVVGGSLSVSEGGAGTLLVGGDAELNETTVGQMATAQATMTGGRVGVLVAGKADLRQSEVLLTTQQAAVLGAVAGVIFFLLSRVFGRSG